MATAAGSRAPLMTIDRLVTMLGTGDRAIDNFCSEVAYGPSAPDGTMGMPSKRGLRCYAKPDVSILCLRSPDGTSEMQGEVGTRLHAETAAGTRDTTIPDSFFLRDLRSILAVHAGAPAFARETRSATPRLLFEGRAPTMRRPAADGTYTLVIEAAGYERATIRVDPSKGVVLEKTVTSLSTGAEVSHEEHRDFVAVARGWLPRLTVYRYGGRTVTVHLWNYRANLSLPLERFAASPHGCDALLAALPDVNPAAVRKGERR